MEMTSAKHKVNEIQKPYRFSDYIIEFFPVLPSGKSIKKAIKDGCFTLNGTTAGTGTWVNEGDIIEFTPPQKPDAKNFSLKLEIVYEDEDLAVINKPSGIPVNGHYFRTVENALPLNLSVTSSDDGYFSPRPVHRLDSQTSGLLIISKNHRAHIALSRQFENGETKKEYAAVVHGLVESGGTVDSPIDGREALSVYEPIKYAESLKNGHLTLLRLGLHTGRTHQLRIHLSMINHPIVGDRIHGNPESTFTGKGLFLASVGIAFTHPSTGKRMEITIEIPKKFESLLSREERRWRRYNGS